MRRHDHKVDFRSYETLVAWALKVRRLAGIENHWTFDICAFIRTKLVQILDKMERGKLAIEFFNRSNLSEAPAFVTFSPLKLHVDWNVWQAAKEGDGRSRFILAHEVGHLLLHDHWAQSFSSNPELRIKFAQPEYSAEWQADILGEHLLLPDDIVVRCDDAEQLVEFCDVDEWLASKRIAAFREATRRKSRYEGDACLECANFTLVRNGTCLKCDTCGGTTGCS